MKLYIALPLQWSYHCILPFLFPQIELMERNNVNHMEQLLVKLAEKQSIHLDSEEGEV